MNANQTVSKNVVIYGFSICGVPGFQTVGAEGASTEKRIFSAVNQIDKELKKIFTEKQSVRDLLNEDTVAYIYTPAQQHKINEAQIAVGRAKSMTNLMFQIKDQISSQQDFSIIGEDKNILTTLDTEAFFERADEIYSKNVSRFMDTWTDIEDGLSKHIADRIASQPARIASEDFTPYLYLCSGSFFGDDAVFPIIMSKNMMREMGADNPITAGYEWILKSLRAIKSYRMTDYLRADSDEARLKIRADITRMDAYMDQVDKVTIKEVCELTSIPGPGKISANQRADMKKLTATLERESEQRLMFQLTVLGKLENILETEHPGKVFR